MSYTELWAKTAQGSNFHPVVCHLLDTAAICQQILKLLPFAAVRRLQIGLGLDETGLRTWVPFLAGAHDTGKVSPPFQFKDTPVLEIVKKLANGSLYDLWLSRPKETPHGIVTACTLPDFLRAQTVTPELADELAAIVGGHHGTIPTFEQIDTVNQGGKRQRASILGDHPETPQWKQWRTEILKALADYCGIQRSSPPTTCDPAATVLLAGITTLSDWLASNQTCFPPAGSKPDLQDYISTLETKVNDALNAAQWHEWQPHEQPLTFLELFENSPRGLQSAVENLMLELQGEPALLIIEAPTGEGKTEAALTVVHWNSSNGMPGAYIGMPTQATGNALYARLKGYLNNWYPAQTINLQLVHSAAALDETFSSSICRLDQIYDEEHKAGGVSASEWFVHRKRALLAPWGVGTVDQALVGILRTRHQFLRLLGLAGKTVILDEVHAYDGYTSRLLDQLVHWCGILGSPVVILSATLNREQRRRLFNSYATGLGMPEPELPEAEYPRLTIYAHGKAIPAPPFAVDELNQDREIKICWIEESEIDAQLGRGPTAIIRSTVKRCQETAMRYEEGTVFHSRFTQEHRQEKEAHCLKQYGKPKAKTDPARPYSLLVATQVIEQSLDVDFDVLISDLCPIDLLIQRIGRLWRHKREQRSVLERVIYLLRPKIDENGLPQFGEDVEGRMVRNRYEQRVYDRHALLRTWYLLRDRPSIVLPQDTTDLIEAAYDLSQTASVNLTQVQQEDWDNSLRHYCNWQKSVEKQAEEVVIPKLNVDFQAWELTHRGISDQDAEAVTRLVNDSMTVIVDTGDGKVISDRPPVDEEVRQVLRQQVRISSPGLIHTLQGLKTPTSWKNVPYLRELPLLRVPTQVGNYSISYDQRLGLRADKKLF